MDPLHGHRGQEYSHPMLDAPRRAFAMGRWIATAASAVVAPRPPGCVAWYEARDRSCQGSTKGKGSAAALFPHRLRHSVSASAEGDGSRSEGRATTGIDATLSARRLAGRVRKMAASPAPSDHGTSASSMHVKYRWTAHRPTASAGCRLRPSGTVCFGPPVARCAMLSGARRAREISSYLHTYQWRAR